MPPHQQPPPQITKLEVSADSLSQFMIETRSSIWSLETQVGQLAKLMADRNQGALPSSTVVNPKEQCQAVTLRSGTKYEGPTVENKGKKIEDQPVTSPAQEEVTEDLPKTEKPKYTESTPKIPYPQRFRKANLDKQFSKFLEEILSNKRNIKDYETVALPEECSAIIQKKLPQKLRDSGSFTIPCTIGNFYCERDLCDLGANINLMSLSVFRRLCLGEARTTMVTPTGRPFIDIPSRPFLATGQALIDVQKGELRLRVKGDEVVFNVFKALKYPRASDSCFSVNVIEEQLSKIKLIEDLLEMSLISQGVEDCDGTEVIEYVNWLNSTGPIYKKKYDELGQGPERPLPSIKKPSVLELKTLPEHLKYAYLGKNDTLPIIIFASLSTVEEEELL
ncbi:uncharacterized protein LOC133779254 [Humulus lupulus]|uniref:uncharacterized protein LOC133779254 n=1 Tax=Humulus lupulus TaxID=3486 RepID=UPI002B412562|nr:uncharacterized protein LOC133779254 [Humulus lupulus]